MGPAPEHPGGSDSDVSHTRTHIIWEEDFSVIVGAGFGNFGVDFGTFGLVLGLLVAKIGLGRVKTTNLDDFSAEIPHLEPQICKTKNVI